MEGEQQEENEARQGGREAQSPSPGSGGGGGGEGAGTGDQPNPAGRRVGGQVALGAELGGDLVAPAPLCSEPSPLS